MTKHLNLLFIQSCFCVKVIEAKVYWRPVRNLNLACYILVFQSISKKTSDKLQHFRNLRQKRV